MGLFRKHRRPEDLGAMIYETLRSGMESDGDLSMECFIQSLDKNPNKLHEQHVGEIMVGLMFGATLAIERSASNRVAERISSGMRSEFLNHIEEQGASQLEKAEWEAIIANNFLAYRKCLEDYSGFEPPWKLGRQFFWNIIAAEEHLAMSIKIATLYMLAARDACQVLLNEHGPTLLVSQNPLL
ncbi:MAG: hypothetical protein O7D34_11355 [Ignavibacteria bacterium]|nr:hypothetical protein [Ignavibacteria bacterium]